MKLIQNKCSFGNLITDISDHLSNFTLLDIKTPSINDRPYIRLFTEDNIKKFNDNFSTELPLISQADLTDTDNAFDTFSNNYMTLFNKYFPYARMSRKELKNKPHITSAVKVNINARNKLYK